MDDDYDDDYGILTRVAVAFLVSIASVAIIGAAALIGAVSLTAQAVQAVRHRP